MRRIAISLVLAIVLSIGPFAFANLPPPDLLWTIAEEAGRSDRDRQAEYFYQFYDTYPTHPKADQALWYWVAISIHEFYPVDDSLGRLDFFVKSFPDHLDPAALSFTRGFVTAAPAINYVSFKAEYWKDQSEPLLRQAIPYFEEAKSVTFRGMSPHFTPCESAMRRTA